MLRASARASVRRLSVTCGGGGGGGGVVGGASLLRTSGSATANGFPVRTVTKDGGGGGKVGIDAGRTSFSSRVDIVFHYRSGGSRSKTTTATGRRLEGGEEKAGSSATAPSSQRMSSSSSSSLLSSKPSCPSFASSSKQRYPDNIGENGGSSSSGSTGGAGMMNADERKRQILEKFFRSSPQRSPNPQQQQQQTSSPQAAYSRQPQPAHRRPPPGSDARRNWEERYAAQQQQSQQQQRRRRQHREQLQQQQHQQKMEHLQPRRHPGGRPLSGSLPTQRVPAAAGTGPNREDDVVGSGSGSSVDSTPGSAGGELGESAPSLSASLDSLRAGRRSQQERAGAMIRQRQRFGHDGIASRRHDGDPLAALRESFARNRQNAQQQQQQQQPEQQQQQGQGQQQQQQQQQPQQQPLQQQSRTSAPSSSLSSLLRPPLAPRPPPPPLPPPSQGRGDSGGGSSSGDPILAAAAAKRSREKQKRKGFGGSGGRGGARDPYFDPTDVTALQSAFRSTPGQNQQRQQQQRRQPAAGDGPRQGTLPPQQQQPQQQRRRQDTAPSWSSPWFKERSTLSEFIRKMQADQLRKTRQERERQQKLREKHEKENGTTDAAAGAAAHILPKWRLTGGYRSDDRSSSGRREQHVDLRDLRRRDREHRQQQQRYDEAAAAPYVRYGFHDSASYALRELMVKRHRQERQEQEQRQQAAAAETAAASNPRDKEIVLPGYPLTVSQASLLFREKVSRVKRALTSLGILSTRASSVSEDDDEDRDESSPSLDTDAMELLALELGVRNVRRPSGASRKRDFLRQRRNAATMAAASAEGETECETAAAEAAAAAASYYESLPPRPPVVCIMGHVDHGKTTLMDALRRRSVAARQQQSGKARNKNKKGKKKGKGGKKNAKNDGEGGGGGKDVAGTEAGGITQIISAFEVAVLPRGEGEEEEAEDLRDEPAYSVNTVTFLDTPGHAAFSGMRRSGSEAADILVLVVAADDGVAEQTVEILESYKSVVGRSSTAANGGDDYDAGLALVVAMNKIDKPGIDVEAAKWRIENQLLERGIPVEGSGDVSKGDYYGPPVPVVPISALTGDGLDDLVEGLLLQAEVMDLRAARDEDAKAEGIVLDARIDRGLGVVVDAVLRWGSLSRGDVVVCGTSRGRVRALQRPSVPGVAVNGKATMALSQAMPSQPVRIVGFDSLPKQGDFLVTVASEQVADDLVTRRKAAAAGEDDDTTVAAATVAELQCSGKDMMSRERRVKLEERYGLDVDDRSTDGSGATTIRIPVVIKADADGTAHAVRDALTGLGEETSTERFRLVIDPIRVAVGPLQPNEVDAAAECDATVVCFAVGGTKNNNGMDEALSNRADEAGVTVLSGDVIYRLLERAKETFLDKYLPAVPVRVVHGRATVKAVYDIGGMNAKVAGLQVVEGILYREAAAATKNAVSSSGGGETLSPCLYRVLRGGRPVHLGRGDEDGSGDEDSNAAAVSGVRASSLKHFKEDVDEISRGMECGLSLVGFNEFEEGDEIECFSVEMKRELFS